MRATGSTRILRSGEQTRKFLTFCAGISSYPGNAVNVDELFTYAGMALYTAKSGGKNKIVRYRRESEDRPPGRKPAVQARAGRKLRPHHLRPHRRH